MRKTFWISQKAALDKLDKVKNQSQYVTDLILSDIAKSYGGLEFEKLVTDTLENIMIQVDMIKKTCLERDEKFFDK